ncbi:hypothetical protein Smp_181400 [Schistosoma mansoni]|uniref:hypothetical protein n=1 Tax=Schistosoma mansoni TaxID=6183 RepID=UPI0001A61C03|nr:hypothetical protein Smp_181400 [Schistosoma mansoni]|eukprot:XP_018651014.1 hypothetical protein Smp_181400 [Schistosoma mansoni]
MSIWDINSLFCKCPTECLNVHTHSDKDHTSQSNQIHLLARVVDIKLLFEYNLNAA